MLRPIPFDGEQRDASAWLLTEFDRTEFEGRYRPGARSVNTIRPMVSIHNDEEIQEFWDADVNNPFITAARWPQPFMGHRLPEATKPVHIDSFRIPVANPMHSHESTFVLDILNVRVSHEYLGDRLDFEATYKDIRMRYTMDGSHLVRYTREQIISQVTAYFKMRIREIDNGEVEHQPL